MEADGVFHAPQDEACNTACHVELNTGGYVDARQKFRLATALRMGQWAIEGLDKLAFDVPRDAVSTDQCRDLAQGLRSLGDALDEYAKLLDEDPRRGLQDIADRGSIETTVDRDQPTP